MIKCGFIADPEILTMIESDPASAVRPDSLMLRELVERAVSVKARVVTADFVRPHRQDPRWAGSCSTMATLSVMRSSVGNASAGATATRSASAWSSLLSWPGSRAARRSNGESTSRSAVQRGIANELRGGRVRRPVADHGARQEDPRLDAAVCDLERLASAEILAAPDEDLLRAAYAAVAA